MLGEVELAARNELYNHLQHLAARFSSCLRLVCEWQWATGQPASTGSFCATHCAITVLASIRLAR